MRTLAIDIVSDLVCPWCLIGVRRLEQALDELPDVRAELRFHPYLLNPDGNIGGGDLREYLKRKYGVEPKRMFDRVEHEARLSGIPLDFEKVTRFCSTIGGHTLLRHAVDKGTQVALKKALLDAYFLEGRDIADASVLAAIASEHGFDVDEATSLLSDEAEARATRDEAQAIVQQGVTGVPFFILGRIAFGGAQGVDTMKQVIERALDEQQSAAEGSA